MDNILKECNYLNQLWLQSTSKYWSQLEPLPWKWEQLMPGWSDECEIGVSEGQIIGTYSNWIFRLIPDESWTHWKISYPMNQLQRRILEMEIPINNNFVEIFYIFEEQLGVLHLSNPTYES